MTTKGKCLCLNHQKLFTAKHTDNALSIDPIVEEISDYVIMETSNLILSKEIAEKTRMSSLLVLPESKQHIVVTLLNVLSCSCCKMCDRMKALKFDAILDVLSRKMGKFCVNVYRNVDEIGQTMENSNAPLPTDLPVVMHGSKERFQ